MKNALRGRKRHFISCTQTNFPMVSGKLEGLVTQTYIWRIYSTYNIYISNIHKRGTLYQKYYQKFVYQKYYEKLVINIITFFIFCIAGYTFLRNLHVHVRARRLWEKYPCGMQIMDIISSTNKCRHSQLMLRLCLRWWEDVKNHLSTS